MNFYKKPIIGVFASEKHVNRNGFKLISWIILFLFFLIISCSTMKNSERQIITEDNTGYFFKTQNGCNIFVYDYQPNNAYETSVFIISGITGINHLNEKDIIDLLGNGENRVVVIHPRGTGYSEGKRGDISEFSTFIDDYIEIIKNDKVYNFEQHKIILYGHSMSTSILLAVADKLKHINGAILVNPPYILKKAKGMSPNLWQYFKFATYLIFDKHKPIVNMAGDPSLIENEEDRKESEQRIHDTLIVKYFSMFMMVESKKIIDSMIVYSTKANYPLLLIHGEKDNIVDQKGCKMIFDAWSFERKKYVIIENGTHGKITVILSKNTINEWFDERKNE
jgi:alpha-beta hydrolase superfamily lysophospholipase